MEEKLKSKFVFDKFDESPSFINSLSEEEYGSVAGSVLSKAVLVVVVKQIDINVLRYAEE